MRRSENNDKHAQPHLMVIGAQKSGTTWLQHVLDCNEPFWYPARFQEVHFFDRCYEKGLDYYLALYRDAPAEKITCDVTPAYLNEPFVDERIAEMGRVIDRPLKFILICREPVARLRSAYEMKVRKGTRLSLGKALEVAPDLIDKGLYYQHLHRYLQRFERPQFLVLILEEVQQNPAAAFEAIVRFLGLETTLSDPYQGVRINAGGLRRTPAVDQVMQLAGRWLRALGWMSVLHAFKRSTPVQWVKRANQVPFSMPAEDERLLKELKNTYHTEVLSFAALIDRPDLPQLWNYV